MKQFKDRAEIAAQPGYQVDQPISLDTYRGLVGWYSFEKEEMRCCSLKDPGSLCKTAHRKGWVARVDGGALTVIGGDCAKNKYEAESSIMRDISQAVKQIDEEAAQARVAELLGHRDEGRAKVVAALQLIEERRRALQGFMEQVGKRNQSRLEDLARTSGEVTVEGRTPPERDSDGEVIKDGRIVSIPLPAMTSLEVCKPSFLAPAADDLRTLRNLYDKADELLQDGGQKGRRLLTAGLQRVDSAVAAAEAAGKAVSAFLECNLIAACFLVNDWKDRSMVGRIAMERAGVTGDPKQWIQRFEGGLRYKYGVTQIRIGVSR